MPSVFLLALFPITDDFFTCLNLFDNTLDSMMRVYVCVFVCVYVCMYVYVCVHYSWLAFDEGKMCFPSAVPDK